MSHEILSPIVLAVVFLVATIRGVNMGALALVASFVVGPAVYDATVADILDGFPSSLFVILVGVTYLFALAKNNGTVDWIVHGAVRAVEVQQRLGHGASLDDAEGWQSFLRAAARG